jgi:hypothetical protein
VYSSFMFRLCDGYEEVIQWNHFLYVRHGAVVRPSS